MRKLRISEQCKERPREEAFANLLRDVFRRGVGKSGLTRSPWTREIRWFKSSHPDQIHLTRGVAFKRVNPREFASALFISGIRGITKPLG